VLDYETATDGQRFAAYCAEHPVDVLKIVPSHFDTLLSALPVGKSTPLFPRCQLIFGGEALSVPLVEKLSGLINEEGLSCQLINHYGPTETTIGALVNADVSHEQAADIAIGQPLAGLALAVVDSAGQPLPAGFAGELYIAGAGVAAGYWQNPQQTAQRFVTQVGLEESLAGQQSAQQDARKNNPIWYTTGDRVALHPATGLCHYLGRTDHQVKIRGFRVELGEVEAQLAQCEGVRSCVLLYKAFSKEEEPRLVAYVVFDEGVNLTLTAIKQQLQDRLPDYMLPQALVALPRLPLNRNGKVDRAALPAPSQGARTVDYVAPRTDLERELCEVFATVLALDVDQLGVHDDFFDSGGHSLAAVRVMNTVRQDIAPGIDPMALFNTHTVAALASVIEQETPGLNERILKPLNNVENARRVLICVAPSARQIQQYDALVSRVAPQAEDLAVVALNPQVLLQASEQARYQSINSAVAVFAETVLADFPEATFYCLGWSFGGVLAQALAGALEGLQAQVDWVAVLDSRLETRTEATANDPLLRYAEYLSDEYQQDLLALPEEQLDIWRQRLLAVPETEQLQTAVVLAREAGVKLDDQGSADWTQLIAARERFHQLLADHQPGLCQAPIRIWWAQQSIERWERQQISPPDWQQYSAATDTVAPEILATDHYGLLEEKVLLDGIAALLIVS